MSPLRKLAAERGTAVIEFALVALPLCLIVFGIIDYSRAMNYYNNLTQLASQGARAAAIDQNPDGSGAAGNSIAVQLASTYTTSPEMRNHVHICIASPTPSLGQVVTVKTLYRVPFFFGLTGLTITAQNSQRAEADASYTTGVDYTDPTNTDGLSAC